MGVKDPWRYPEFLCGCKRPVDCNTPKYTLVVFDMIREFCKHNFSLFKCKTWKFENSEFVQDIRANM